MPPTYSVEINLILIALTRSPFFGFPVFPLRTTACRTEELFSRRRSINVLRASTENAVRPSCRFDLQLSRTKRIPCPTETDRCLWSGQRLTARPPRISRRLKENEYNFINEFRNLLVVYFVRIITYSP